MAGAGRNLAAGGRADLSCLRRQAGACGDGAARPRAPRPLWTLLLCPLVTIPPHPFLLPKSSPDILHAHDWQSAPCTWLDCGTARTAFTIHNLNYGADLIERAMGATAVATTVRGLCGGKGVHGGKGEGRRGGFETCMGHAWEWSPARAWPAPPAAPGCQNSASTHPPPPHPSSHPFLPPQRTS